MLRVDLEERTGITKGKGRTVWSTLPVGCVDSGTMQLTPVLLVAKILFGNLRVSSGVRRGPPEQSVEQDYSGCCN